MKWLRAHFTQILFLLAVLVIIVAVVACGEEDFGNKPTLAEVFEDSETGTTILPDGRPVECLFYAEGGHHESWLAFDCWPADE